MKPHDEKYIRTRVKATGKFEIYYVQELLAEVDRLRGSLPDEKKQCEECIQNGRTTQCVDCNKKYILVTQEELDAERELVKGWVTQACADAVRIFDCVDPARTHPETVQEATDYVREQFKMLYNGEYKERGGRPREIQ